MAIPEHKDKILKTIEIQNKLIDASALIDENTRQAFKLQSAFIKEFLVKNPNANSYQLKSLTNMILTRWNESVSPDTEKFWMEMKRNNINFVRKEPLRWALTRGRFYNVEQGIDARNHWRTLKQLPAITNSYTTTEMEKIDRIIEEDEKKRYAVLKKCLINKSIPQTQYLKFGECMAYFGRCDLFKTYFSQQQVNELYTIWTNFKSN